ncbi:carboxypeptidase-like regulatory domain-containing protein [Chitinophaga arvensicola]|uniref:Alpha/beta hydrolase family protein n=1 Tax=Chitinophaga arvensicola TaxID=29529 RepID=A0A1I0RST9_9BACT|nr:carboxypeptidase-like regulatory domain-containing protein [Chitinophaga arvensicola]SEW44303.1 Alpha/beta hydrolase family protein [Chitinophaga arvensicola]
MKGLYAFTLCIFSVASITAQSYQAGYRAIFLTDSSRIYKPGSHAGHQLHFRPLEVDVWYPAQTTAGSMPIPFSTFVGLLEQRANRFQDDTVYNGMSAELLQYIAANVNIADTAMLSCLRTSSYRDTPPIKQRFPLIIYMCGYDGMSYENIPLFESLAAHGYVVAAITSVGRYPGDMHTKAADLMEQVKDGLFAWHYLQEQVYTMPGKTGVMGYSWGGLAASIMAMQTQQINAVLSFDGSEIHYYGNSQEEDNDFNALRQAHYFQAAAINAPYAYLESDRKQEDYPADSIFRILPALHTSKRYFRFAGAGHEDFSCLPSLPSFISGKVPDSNQVYTQSCLYARLFFDEYLKNKPRALREQELSLLRRHLADTLYPIAAGIADKNTTIVKGMVRDGQTGQPLPFTNIGVPHQNIGTVSAQNGSFRLQLHAGKEADSVRVSMVGYRDSTYAISTGQAPLVFTLFPRVTKLKEAVAVARLQPARIIGSTSTSKSMSFGFPLKFLGSEIGSRMQLGKKDVLLKRFRFTVAENRLDTAVFRLNIYRFADGLPAENILQESIIVGVGSQRGTYAIDLSAYHLLMHGDVFVALEWVQGASTQKHGAIFLSAALLHGATWHRTISEGEWKKFGAVSVGFNMTVQPLAGE